MIYWPKVERPTMDLFRRMDNFILGLNPSALKCFSIDTIFDIAKHFHRSQSSQDTGQGYSQIYVIIIPLT